MNVNTQYLQKALQRTCKERDDILELAQYMEQLLDETCSVACAWAFEEGQGMPHLSQEQLVELVGLKYAESRA